MNKVTATRRFAPRPLGNDVGMTTTTTDVTDTAAAALDAVSPAESATHDQPDAATAEHSVHAAQTLAHATARRARRQDNAAWASLAVGLLICLVTFGSIAWTDSGASTGNETTAPAPATR